MAACGYDLVISLYILDTADWAEPYVLWSVFREKIKHVWWDSYFLGVNALLRLMDTNIYVILKTFSENFLKQKMFKEKFLGISREFCV